MGVCKPPEGEQGIQNKPGVNPYIRGYLDPRIAEAF